MARFEIRKLKLFLVVGGDQSMMNSNAARLPAENNSLNLCKLQNLLAQGDRATGDDAKNNHYDEAAAFVITTVHETANNSMPFRAALTVDKPTMERILSLDHPGLTTALLTVTAQQISKNGRLPGTVDEAANAAAIEFLKKLLLKAAPQKDAESNLHMTILMEKLAASSTHRAEAFVTDAAFMENLAFHSQSPRCANALGHMIETAVTRAWNDTDQLASIGAGIHAGLRGAARQDFVANGMAESLLSTVVRYPDSALRRDIISDPALAPLFGNRFLKIELRDLAVKILSETEDQTLLRQEIAEKIEGYYPRRAIWEALNAANKEQYKRVSYKTKPDGFLARARGIFTPRFKKPPDPA